MQTEPAQPLVAALDAPDAKSRYEPPAIRALGSIAEVTQGTTGLALTDSGGVSV